MTVETRCGACGNELATDERYCPACGALRPDPRGEFGRSLSADARFCSHCGKPRFEHSGGGSEAASPAVFADIAIPEGLREKFEEVRSELKGERREVVVLFSDVVGFTAISERLDPEEISLLMNRLLPDLAACVFAYEGYVDKFIGDSVMALFGAPLAHENDPERAVLAGLSMLDVVRRHGEEIGAPLALRVGINVGEVVAVYLESGGRLEYTVFGDTVNIASRLEGKAEPNSVLVSESIHARLRGRFSAEELPPLELKGKAQPIRAFRIGEYRADEGERGEDATPFVGRERELTVIGSFLTRTAGGIGASLLVQAEAGGGKTRLVEEAIDRGNAALQAIRIELSPIDLPGQRSPASEIFRQLAPVEGRDALDWAIRLLAASGEKHRPGVTGLARESFPEAAMDAANEGDASAARQNRWLAIAALLQAAAADRPILLWVDDAHWADEAMQEFLEFLLPAVSNAPIGILVTARPDGVGDWLPEDIERLTIEPLDESAAASLLGELSQELDVEDRRELIRRSQGNPLFLGELARALQESGGTVSSLPGTVQGLIKTRIDHLDPPVRSLLHMAAVLGGRFPLALLDRMYGLERHAQGFRASFERLNEGGFVTLDGDNDEGRFSHALMQEVAYGGILMRIRRVLHESAARIGEEVFEDRIDDEAPFFAHHFWEAGLKIQAAPHLWVAGRTAAEGYDLHTAERFLCREAEILEERPDVLGDSAQLASFSEILGNVLLHRGDLDAADAWFTRLERLGEEEGQPGWRARGLLHQGVGAWYRGQLDDALAYAGRGLEDLPPGEEKVAADLFNLTGLVHYYRRNADEAFSAHGEALRLRKAVDDRLGMAKSLGNIGNLLVDFRDDLDGGEEHYRQALELGEAIANRQVQTQSLNCLGNLAMERGDWKRAVEIFHQAELILEEIGWPFLRYITLECQALCEIALGRIEVALKHLRPCLTRGDEVLEPINRVNIRLHLFDAYLKACADERARDVLTEARRIATELNVEEDTEISIREGRLAIAEERWPEAAGFFEAAGEAARRFSLPATVELAEAHRLRALLLAGKQAEDPEPVPPITGRMAHHAVLDFLNASAAAAVRGATPEVALALERVADQAAELGEISLERAAAERLAEILMELGDETGEESATARAIFAMNRLAANLPDDLRPDFENHPRNRKLRERENRAFNIDGAGRGA